MSDKSEPKRGKKLDLFCWKCHKSETNIGCSRCERSFHNKCISMTKNIKDFAPNWVCNECTDASPDSNCPLNLIQLKEMLLSSLKRISKSADYYFKSENCFTDKRIKVNSNLIVNPLNLNKIEEKVNDFQYKCFSQMTSDFKWISHNCIIAKLDSELLSNAKFLLSKVKDDQKDFEECVNCFINYYTYSKKKYYSWFSKPCPQMHPIVWAQVRGHPYWPSKVIKVNSPTNSVLVRFFGTHEKALVKEKDCYLISEENPKELSGKSLQKAPQLKAALEELKYSIEYLNEEYPNWFQYAPKHSPFYMKDIISKINSNSNLNDNISNRPNDWRPKARKTFPTPQSSLKLKKSPIEITFKGSKEDKKSKTKQNIEIIEFNSNNKRELNLSNESIAKRIKTEVKSEAKNDCQTFEYITQISNNIKVSTIEPIESRLNSNTKPKIESDVKNDKKVANISKGITKSDLKETVNSLRLRVKSLEKMIETKDNNYRKQIIEMQQKSDLALEQMRRSLEIDKQRLVEELNKQIAINNQKLDEMKTSFETEMNLKIEKHNSEIQDLRLNFEKELKESKTKIWCFSCLKEAQLYCCSHTYYCSNECQLNHWESHKKICTQK